MDCCHKLRLPTTLFVSFALLFFFFISLVFFVVGKEDVMFKLISIISIHYVARVWLALRNPTWRCVRSLTVVVNITVTTHGPKQRLRFYNLVILRISYGCSMLHKTDQEFDHPPSVSFD